MADDLIQYYEFVKYIKNEINCSLFLFSINILVIIIMIILIFSIIFLILLLFKSNYALNI